MAPRGARFWLSHATAPHTPCQSPCLAPAFWFRSLMRQPQPSCQVSVPRTSLIAQPILAIGNTLPTLQIVAPRLEDTYSPYCATPPTPHFTGNPAGGGHTNGPTPCSSHWLTWCSCCPAHSMPWPVAPALPSSAAPATSLREAVTIPACVAFAVAHATHCCTKAACVHVSSMPMSGERE